MTITEINLKWDFNFYYMSCPALLLHRFVLETNRTVTVIAPLIQFHSYFNSRKCGFLFWAFDLMLLCEHEWACGAWRCFVRPVLLQTVSLSSRLLNLLLMLLSLLLWPWPHRRCRPTVHPLGQRFSPSLRPAPGSRTREDWPELLSEGVERKSKSN